MVFKRALFVSSGRICHDQWVEQKQAK